MRPVEYINELKEQYANTDIDWELILELGYRLFLDRRSTVIDIGGHAGRHAGVFIDAIGCERVLVFEPLPAQFELLRERYEARKSVDLFNCALGAKAGTADFVFNRHSPEESGLQERAYNDPANKMLETLRVEVKSLDRMPLHLDHLDYVKIDTEGGEIDILLGAQETLHEFRPVVSVEYGASSYTAYGKTRSSLFELAGEMGYVLFDLFGHAIATAEDWDECADNFYWDFYMVPGERAQRFNALLSGRILDAVPNCLTGRARG